LFPPFFVGAWNKIAFRRHIMRFRWWRRQIIWWTCRKTFPPLWNSPLEANLRFCFLPDPFVHSTSSWPPPLYRGAKPIPTRFNFTKNRLYIVLKSNDMIRLLIKVISDQNVFTCTLRLMQNLNTSCRCTERAYIISIFFHFLRAPCQQQSTVFIFLTRPLRIARNEKLLNLLHTIFFSSHLSSFWFRSANAASIAADNPILCIGSFQVILFSLESADVPEE